MPGGVFVFFDGHPAGKPDRYVFLPQRIEFSGLGGSKNLLELDDASKIHIKNIFETKLSEPPEYNLVKINPGRR